MNNLSNFNKIVPILKSQHQEPLDRTIMQDYTPRLWGNTLIKRSSHEGRVTDFIRWSLSIDDQQRKWKHIFRDMFIPETDQIINNFSDKEKNEIFNLKYDYAKENKKSKDTLNKSARSTLLKSKGDNLIPLHWTKDSEQLKRLSLLRTWPSNTRNSADTQIIEALFGLNNEEIYTPEFLDKFISHVTQNLASQLAQNDANRTN